jgi:hypothetical protein
VQTAPHPQTDVPQQWIKEIIMKMLLFACALVQGALLSDFAMASSYTIHSRPEDKAFAAFPVMNPAPQHLFRSGNECATDRASAVFGSTGNMLGYECFNYSGG